MKYKVHRLTEAEREFLETGEAPGRYRTHEMEANIREKVEILPTRFQDLADDIEILSENNYLDAEIWADSWLELLGIELSEINEYPTDVFTHSSSEVETQLGYPTPPERFGHEIGKMICRLMLYPRVEDENVQLDVAWGFLEGMYELTDESVHDSLSRLEERSEQRQETAEQVVRGLRISRQEIQGSGERIHNRIADILDEEGLRPTEWMVQKVHTELQNERGEFLRKEVEEENWSVETAITSEMVREVVLKNRLREKQHLRKVIRKDAEQVIDKAGNPTGRDILVGVFEHENSEVSSRTVAEELNETRDWTSRVTRIARDLAGDTDGDQEWEHRDIWEDRPVLDGSKEGWRTTAYGDVLASCLSESSLQLIKSNPFLPLSKEDINAALDELDINSCLQ